ncbi:unnamed protein product [Cochlearia groenlandica]
MSKSRDKEIKLFGRTITSIFAGDHYDQPSCLSLVHGGSDQSKEASSYTSSSCSPSIKPNTVLFKNPYILSDLNQHPKTQSEIPSPRSSKTNGDQHSEITTTTTSISQDQKHPTITTLKKPDKILPCPRCESENTKFCYYNNYNVNQPRYFCRNCQRYWTSGGSMRSVPVGSGRRKNKGWATSNPYLQVTSENSHNNNNSGTILSFGSFESSVTENSKNQVRDTKITADSASQEHNAHKGFLAPQVMSPWTYHSNLYPVPFFWGCAVPLWPTSESTSPCLGKRTRDQTQGGNKHTSTSITRPRLVSESLRVDTEQPNQATKSAVWDKLSTKLEKERKGFGLFNGFETKSIKNVNRASLVPETSISLQANPAAMSRSMNFRESTHQ